MTDKFNEQHVWVSDLLAHHAAEENPAPSPYPDLEYHSYRLLLIMYRITKSAQDELEVLTGRDPDEWTLLTVLQCWPPGKEPLTSSFRNLREKIGQLSEANASSLRSAIDRFERTGDKRVLLDSLIWARIVIAFYLPIVVPWLQAGAADADAGANEPPPPGGMIMSGWLTALNTLQVPRERDRDQNDMREAAPLLELALKRYEKRGPLVEGRTENATAYQMHLLRTTASRVFRAVGRTHEATRQMQLCLDEEEERMQAGRPLQLIGHDLVDFGGSMKLQHAVMAMEVAWGEYESARWKSALPRLLVAFDRGAAAGVPIDDSCLMRGRFAACVCRGIADATEAGRSVPGRKELHLMFRRLEIAKQLFNDMHHGNQRISPQQILSSLVKSTAEFEREFGPDSIALLPSLRTTAECLQAAGDRNAFLETARRFLHLAGTDAARSLLSPHDLGMVHAEIGIELQDNMHDHVAAKAELRIAVGYFKESLGISHPTTVVTLARMCGAMVDGGADAAETTATAKFNPTVVSEFEEALAAANTCIERPQNTTTMLIDIDDSGPAPLERAMRARQLLDARCARADVLIGLSRELLKSTVTEHEARRVAQARGQLLQAKDDLSQLRAPYQQQNMTGFVAHSRQRLEEIERLLAKVKQLEKAAAKRR